MQADLQLHYLGTLSTEEFVKQAYGDKPVEKEIRQEIENDVGTSLYRLLVTDPYQKREIIKSKKEVQKFFKWCHCSYNLGVEMEGKKIEEISEKSKIKDYGWDFLELQGSQLFKSKFLKLKKLVVGSLKWYQKAWNYIVPDFLDINDEHPEPAEIFITKEGILEKTKEKQSDFFLFTSEFDYVWGKEKTGEKYGVILYSAHREVQYQTQNIMDYLSLLYFIGTAIKEVRKRVTNYNAISYQRKINSVHYLINAESYFREFCKVVQSAKSQIFITDWMFSPELPLIRPYNEENQKYRLDRLLKRKAEAGVKIYILIYNDYLGTQTNGSEQAVKKMKNLHPNIKITSHPRNQWCASLIKLIDVFYSHHQKIVVVDEQVAFVGGTDLCFGRYDSNDHPINNNSPLMYPGIEYNNFRKANLDDLDKYQKEPIPRQQPRLPWQEISMKVQGRVVTDLANQFIEYWNYVVLEEVTLQEYEGPELKQMIQEQKKIIQIEENANKKVQSNLEAMAEENIERKRKCVEQLYEKKQKIVKENSFVRKNMAKKDNDRLVLCYKNLGLIKLDAQEWKKKQMLFNDECQMVRSASKWSIGLEKTFDKEIGNDRHKSFFGHYQRSVLNAYMEEITNAKNFIYIENQFFITSTEEGQTIKNLIGQKIYQRIKRAVENKEKFKVYVMMPIIPGFACDSSKGLTDHFFQMIMAWQYNSICRGGTSLYEKLKKITPNPKDYIEFYGGRQHGLLNGKPVTEQVYIHTKTMIIDDQIVICGSANIGDRSQLGWRDSEICLVIKGGNRVKKIINSKQTQVSEKAHKLRMDLWKMHFGFTHDCQCEDPLDEKVIDSIRLRTRVNTQIYRELFGCPPDDLIIKIEDHKKLEKQPDVQKYLQMSKKIVGYAVEMPLHFLEGEDLFDKTNWSLKDKLLFPDVVYS